VIQAIQWSSHAGQLPALLQAPGEPQAAFNQNPRTRAGPRGWPVAQEQPDFVGTMREFGGWLGVWNCEAAG
jgi:hypothetical protein